EYANVNGIEGVTHMVFHTYTHSPQIDFLPPGSSLGAGFGTPFLRGQTWWRHMPEFTTYLARCSYMLERGRPVSDVLWYLGDEIDHKPNQNAPFPAGYKYDYCNPDVLLNRLAVRNGQLVTPEGIAYRLLWLPQNERMLPETLEKILALAKAGATIVGNAPRCLATLSGGKKAQQRFNKAVKALWGNAAAQQVRTIGKGKLISGYSIDEALTLLNIQPDVKVVSGATPLWSHRQVDGADWYFVCAPHGTGKDGIKTRLSFRSKGEVEVWDPVTGEPMNENSATYRVDIQPSTNAAGQTVIEHSNVHPYSASVRKGDRTEVSLTLPPSGSYFVVFKPSSETDVKVNTEFTLGNNLLPLNNWTLSFPEGWGAPASIELYTLRAWKDLDISAEGRAFSGTAVYTTTFDAGDNPKNIYMLDLGRVEMIASVWLNGKHVRTLWASPYTVELGKYVQAGVNTLRIEVTSSWFNRLVYDASLPEAERKTWTISAPSKDAPLRESGLLGPVRISDVKPASTMRYLENERVKLGIDLSIGGAVTYLTDRDNGGQNMINSSDWGRQIQMSYYSGPRPYIGPNGEQPEVHWAGLGWNPIQSGDAGNNRSKVIAFEQRGTNAMFVRCIPMQWPHKTGVSGDCEFECLYTLEGNVITMEATIINKRTDTTQYNACPQEMPAVYTNGAWYNLVSYLGDEPFSGKPVTKIVARNDGKGWPWVHFYTPENWAALLDDNGKGVGVFQPDVMNFNGGFHPSEAMKGAGTAKDMQTGHIAPIGTQILDHNIRWTYKTHFILGTIDDIRSYAKKYEKNNTTEWRFDRSRQNWYYSGGASDAGWATKGFLDLRFKKNAALESPVTFWKAAKLPFLDVEGAFETASGEITLKVEIQPVSKSDFTDWLNWSEGQWNAEEEKEQKKSLYPSSPPLVYHKTIKADGVNRIHRINLASLPNYKKAFKSLKISFSEDGTAQVRGIVIGD
ncbi:MAG: hypothetical protein LBD59_07560, partial [Prevotellaceae bacterium]|nr:hypothetical protein [Prevotellaceae bacterium]